MIKKVKFKNECLTLLVGLIEKLVERCPLRYNIVRHSSCFDPLEIVNHTDACILKANRLIDIIFQSTWVSENEADKAKQEYGDFVSSACVE